MEFALVLQKKKLNIDERFFSDLNCRFVVFFKFSFNASLRAGIET